MNVDNIKTSHLYVAELMKTCDILLMQEHWLYGYEKHMLGPMFPDCRYFAKSCDDTDPVTPHLHRKGHAGVAVLWKASVDDIVEVQEREGNDRIIVTLLGRSPGRQIAILNTYMPAGNGQADISKYEDMLDKICEITRKYVACSAVIWLGDLNGSFG